MDATEFITERNRMCNSFSPDCEGCRVDEAKPVMSECFRWILDNPQKAVQIVEGWSAAHPRKTRQSVFLEQWPEANTDDTGAPLVLPCTLISSFSRSRYCGRRENCVVCRREFWNQEVK